MDVGSGVVETTVAAAASEDGGEVCCVPGPKSYIYTHAHIRGYNSGSYYNKLLYCNATSLCTSDF